MPRYTEVTTTTLVFGALRDVDDFLSAPMLVAKTGRSRNQVSAALIHLRKVRAVDVIVEPGGVGWWFVTPDSDQRSRVVTERTPEKPGTRRRKPRK